MDLLQAEWELEVTAEPITPAILVRLEALGARTLPSANGATLTLALPDRALVPKVAEAIVTGGAALYELKVTQRSLEDLFVASVEGGTE